MTKGLCQKAGEEFQSTTEHGAFGIDVWQKTAKQSRTDGERFRRQDVPAHCAQHGKAANQQMGTSGHAPYMVCFDVPRKLFVHKTFTDAATF